MSETLKSGILRGTNMSQLVKRKVILKRPLERDMWVPMGGNECKKHVFSSLGGWKEVRSHHSHFFPDPGSQKSIGQKHPKNTIENETMRITLYNFIKMKSLPSPSTDGCKLYPLKSRELSEIPWNLQVVTAPHLTQTGGPSKTPSSPAEFRCVGINGSLCFEMQGVWHINI